MPTKTAKDLKAVDENKRRVWCRDGHRIEWTAEPDLGRDEHNLLYGGRDSVERAKGLCSAGDHWSMKWVGSRKTGHYQLDHEGNARWTRTGQFKVTRDTTWATAAHVASGERIVSFDCSHHHYPAGGGIAISRDKSREAYYASLPPVIRDATGTPSMIDAVNQTTDQGWDWITNDRIRCVRCVAEEVALEAKLAELAKGDAA